MDSGEFGFDETVDLLSNILPARALQHVVAEMTDEQRCALATKGLNDATVSLLLDEKGVPRLHVVRHAIRALLDAGPVSSDVFGSVDPYLRDEKNPLLVHVRQLVSSVLRNV